MLRQYGQIKAHYPDAILMFRLGDFYEMFFEDAVEAAGLLEITLTSRNKKDENPIPLCGVPYHSVEPYISKLLECGKKVAICEQVEDPRQAKGVVRREVTRVLTPGVVPDGLGLSARSHNFLAVIAPPGDRFGLAIADASTGLFQAFEFDGKNGLFDELLRAEPREVLLLKGPGEGPISVDEVKKRLPQALIAAFSPENGVCGRLSGVEGGEELVRDLPAAATAAGAVLQYLSETQLGRVGQIQRVQATSQQRCMRLDEASCRNLELVRTLQEGGRIGSLLHALDRTATAPGARQLKRWLLSPLTDPAGIDARLDAVGAICGDGGLLKSLPEVLSRVHDLERIVSRVILGSAHARDLLALKDSLLAAGELRERIAGRAGMLGTLSGEIDACPEVTSAITATIADDPPLTLREGGLIRAGWDPELDALRDVIAHGKETIAGIEAKERAATGIGSLKVRFNRVFGYYLEVTNANRDRVPAHFIRRQTLANAERFVTPELKEHEERVLGAQEKVRALEQELFGRLRDQVAGHARRLQATAGALAAVDALSSLAIVAAEYGYVRPQLHAGREIEIVEGRHPIVERADPAVRFVPNDVRLAGEAPELMLITGPNMAGKSTVMRQTALIVLMAQIGSFVPAKSARIGIADRIFTRVGASDALAQGHSTFMVEMSEAAVILREATERSLVIIDEIGRGTSTFDGLAIAWAVAEDLHDRVRSRTMFATHYHELTELALTRPRIQNFHVAVREWNGQVIFLRRLVPGATSRSYGIAVAGLAGLPPGVIGRATEVLTNLEQGELDERGQPRLASHHGAGAPDAAAAQYQLFQPGSRLTEIEQRLRGIDATAITPIEAIAILHDLTKTIA